MDKKSLTGLVLIGLIFALFTIINQPSEKEQKEMAKREAEKRKREAEKKNIAVEATKKSTDKPQKQVSKVSKEETYYRIENDKLIVDLSSKGGKVAAVYLKEYESYKDFQKKDGKITPLMLFGKNDATNQLVYSKNGKTYATGNLDFEVVKKSNSELEFQYVSSDDEVIRYSYNLQDGAYDLDYTIFLNGFKNVSSKNILLDWKANFRKTEKLLKSQRMVSTVCFMNKETGMDYLSEASDDDEKAEEDLNWVAFKQSYFSAILKSDNGFAKEGSSFKIRNYSDSDKNRWTHLKKYEAKLNLNLNEGGEKVVQMSWFFGPNDYNLLKSYESGYDDILNFGWGLFRWINLYAVEPIFSLFTDNLGLSVGISILLLTLVLKLILTPIQWKMFVSSAKMRILKPEIDELNTKYPNKEDAMKKQMDMMNLYKESGASPLSGCVPMLIQMPILLAVFRFFPASFDMRQEAFLWADDLSTFDSIFDFGFNLWPYGDHISLFTLLMSATTLIYTFLNSGNTVQPQQPGMPNMKVIMYIFPIMMIFIFNDYSAGLSYYYFISTLISILLMIAIKNWFVDEEKLKAKMAAKKAEKVATPKKKSKFQERLEQMQKMQQEQRNMRKK
jgi:YidC/Oxa1 family membrane protein insertase